MAHNEQAQKLYDEIRQDPKLAAMTQQQCRAKAGSLNESADMMSSDEDRQYDYRQAALAWHWLANDRK